MSNVRIRSDLAQGAGEKGRTCFFLSHWVRDSTFSEVSVSGCPVRTRLDRCYVTSRKEPILRESLGRGTQPRHDSHLMPL